MRLYVIRHGQTDWNVAHRIQGRQDICLNATGREQAARLAKAMEQFSLDAVFSSPQKRAYETAAAVAAVSGVPIRTLPQLMEINYGSWEGKTSNEILRTDKKLYEDWWEHPATVAPPGGETLGQVDERCMEAWKAICSQLKGDSAIVSHGATLAHLMALLLTDAGQDGNMVVHNASITTLDYEPGTGQCRLLSWNDCRHLMT